MNFLNACEEGNLEKAKYISERKNIDIHAYDEYAFYSACCNGHFEVAQWLIKISEEKKLGIIDIHAKNEIAFRWACENDHLEVAKWLLTLYTYRELINLNHPLAKEELEKRKINIELILYLYEKKFKLLDIHAIAISWRDYL